ncbi:MAG: hypothetical protein V2A73_20875, partial [Pseudomonadota bacterium]
LLNMPIETPSASPCTDPGPSGSFSVVGEKDFAGSTWAWAVMGARAARVARRTATRMRTFRQEDAKHV